MAIYGHIGDGNTHVNPLLNLNDRSDFRKMESLSREIHAVVIEKFGGSLCGEHGDGRVRAEFLSSLYGEEVYALFKRVKKSFDPEGLMNPGVKISETPFTENIDYERYTKTCATCGKCNAVCPVYDVLGEESNAARGWFHILTAPDYSYEKAGRAVEACINCKSCRTVCPAGIDVSALVLKKREERPNRAAQRMARLQSRESLFLGIVKTLAWTQPLWDRRPVRYLIEAVSSFFLKKLAPTARIPASLTLPRLARRTLRERHSELWGKDGTVAYFHGCAANYFDDGVGDAVIRQLRRRGIEPALPPQRCSGTPLQTYGLKREVLENARFNLQSLLKFDTVVTGCASCTLMLKD
ncbi:MAG TPA: FAD-linked oxidase C-terminal domain-containing protein, partial [Nitrospiria bacterium]|nr:FAD-linked oxidase C-terminal domain-containing protein [Nitrospiria bacterium]